MCGRYTQAKPFEKVKQRFDLEHAEADPPPRYNIAPGQDSAVIVRDDARTLRMMRWGLVPPWAKDEKMGYRMINARAETITEKPSFRNPFRQRRCLIPADGFYEWKKSEADGRKVPYRFTLKDEELFGFAGLWESRKTAGGGILCTFTIITTAANDVVRFIHDRMPVILKPEDEATWLNAVGKDPDELRALLKPYPADEMTTYEVSSIVNSAANDTPECMERP